MILAALTHIHIVCHTLLSSSYTDVIFHRWLCLQEPITMAHDNMSTYTDTHVNIRICICPTDYPLLMKRRGLLAFSNKSLKHQLLSFNPRFGFVIKKLDSMQSSVSSLP